MTEEMPKERTALVPRKLSDVVKVEKGVPPMDQAVLDIEAARLRGQRMTYREIAAEMGCSAATAHDRVKRAYRDARVEATDLARQFERDRLDHLWRRADKIARTVHYVSAHGKVVIDPDTGKPLVDPMPVLAAQKEMRALAESYRKLEGLDQPSRVEQTGTVEYKVVGVDPSELT